jgi:hypothetical protein
MVREDPRCSAANPLFAEIEQPGVGRVLAAASPLQPAIPPRPAPRLGADTDAVLTELLGLPADRLAAYREAGILPRTHGSALFTRGETQALVVTTLGTGDDEQFIDSLEGTYKETFLLHYNFPPYSVGEAGRMGSPGRREIGHGKLAWRAINPIRPKAEEFPYTIRVVSEITESNGSSSMATVCGTSLALASLKSAVNLSATSFWVAGPFVLPQSPSA